MIFKESLRLVLNWLPACRPERPLTGAVFVVNVDHFKSNSGGKKIREQ